MLRKPRLWIVFGLVILGGCGSKGTVVIAPPPANTSENTAKATSDDTTFVAMPPPGELSADSKYDIAVGDAMARLAEGRLNDALVALEKAKSAKDTEFVRNEIDQLKQRLEITKWSERTADDIRIVLTQGRADEAARLATQALIQFGGGDFGDRFASLKQQADALLLTSQDKAGQADRWQKEAETAANEKNYRAALVAYEQALAVKPDPQVQIRCDEIRNIVNRYDELRAKADQLRRDHFQLEEAINSYRQAAAIWDTVQVRNDIDSCSLALQNRRDRIAIADFEVRAEVGIPHAGRVVAEELIGPLRARFDIVERQQFDRLLAEANIQSSDLNDDLAAQRDLGKVAKVKYLVLGSVTPTFGGIMVHARMVDVNSGLVVQTAKLVVANPVELTKQAPQLAQQLMMSDTERMNYEQGLAKVATVPVIEPREVPPPPVVSSRVAPPAAIIPFLPRCPDEGGAGIDDFNRLPPVAPRDGAIGVGFSIDRDHKARLRLTQLSIELGDNLFRRGLFHDAFAQFQLALSLNPGEANIQARIDQCRPHVPAPLPIPVRQRLVVLDFVTPRPSGSLPLGIGPWIADQLAPYYSPTYSVLDRGAMYWYMGRLGLSLRDVILDPMTRAYLGQALNTRYFIIGTVRHLPAGFEATAHMMDVATNIRVDVATVKARTLQELKCRIPELAQWMLTDPGTRIAWQQSADRYQQLLTEGELLCSQNNFGQAVVVYRQARQLRPNDLAVAALLAQAEQNARQTEWRTQRRTEWQQAQVQTVAFRQRHIELQRDADAARQAAERQAAAIATAERERQRRAAFDQLVVQARQARDRQHWNQAAQLYESALGLDRNPEVTSEYEGVKTRIQEFNRIKSAEDRAAQETKLRQQREAEIAQLKQQAEQDRRRRESEELARKRNQEERDRAEYVRLMENAQNLQNNKRFDEAIGLLMQAKQLRPGPEVDDKLAQAYNAKSAASADAQRLAAEKTKKEDDAKAKAGPPVVVINPPPTSNPQPKAETPPPLPKEKPKAETPPPLPKEKPKAETPHPLPKEKPKAEEPPPLPKEKPKSETPPPLPKEKPKAETPPPIPKEKPKTETPPPLPKEKPKAETPPPLPKEKPKAETPPPLPKEKPKSETPPPLPKEKPKVETPPPLPKDKAKSQEKPKGPPAEYAKKMDAGATAERQGKFGEAEQAYKDALKVVPNDQVATKRAEYAKQMDAGIKAMNARKFADAVKAFEAALKAAPGDRVANQQLQRAKQSK